MYVCGFRENNSLLLNDKCTDISPLLNRKGGTASYNKKQKKNTLKQNAHRIVSFPVSYGRPLSGPNWRLLCHANAAGQLDIREIDTYAQ